MCQLCERVQLTKKQEYSFLIKEFKHSYLFLGEHQFYHGYCVLVAKEHYREMSEIPSPIREEIFGELMASSQALINTFQPKKMNLASYGNVVEHLHWHLFPRYQTDPLFNNPPWLQMSEFASKKTTPLLSDTLRAQILPNLV